METTSVFEQRSRSQVPSTLQLELSDFSNLGQNVLRHNVSVTFSNQPYLILVWPKLTYGSFGTPSISVEWVKLATSNLVKYRLTVVLCLAKA